MQAVADARRAAEVMGQDDVSRQLYAADSGLYGPTVDAYILAAELAANAASQQLDAQRQLLAFRVYSDPAAPTTFELPQGSRPYNGPSDPGPPPVPWRPMFHHEGTSSPARWPFRFNEHDATVPIWTVLPGGVIVGPGGERMRLHDEPPSFPPPHVTLLDDRPARRIRGCRLTTALTAALLTLTRAIIGQRP